MKRKPGEKLTPEIFSRLKIPGLRYLYPQPAKSLWQNCIYGVNAPPSPMKAIKIQFKGPEPENI